MPCPILITTLMLSNHLFHVGLVFPAPPLPHFPSAAQPQCRTANASDHNSPSQGGLNPSLFSRRPCWSRDHYPSCPSSCLAYLPGLPICKVSPSTPSSLVLNPPGAPGLSLHLVSIAAHNHCAPLSHSLPPCP